MRGVRLNGPGARAGWLAGGALLALVALPARAADAPEPGHPHEAPRREASQPPNLECTNIRRLSDNHVLDLKLRFMFRPNAQSYARLENAGRGWQFVGERPYLAATPVQVVLAEDQALTAYIERLTGDYYHIDKTGTGLSMWGRCVPVSGFYRAF